jgi:hypothetical protein
LNEMVSEKDLIIAYIKAHLDNGFVLVLTPHQYELVPTELKDHLNIKVNRPVPFR